MSKRFGQNVRRMIHVLGGMGSSIKCGKAETRVDRRSVDPKEKGGQREGDGKLRGRKG